MSVWAKSSVPGSSYSDAGMIVDMGAVAPTGYGIYVEHSDDRVRGYYNNTDRVAGAVVDTNWHFYTLTYNGVFLALYIDGARQGGDLAVAVGAITDYPLRIGAQSKALTRYFNGLIDDVRIYNRALSLDEIQAIYGGI